MATVVVCDDDRVARASISVTCEEAGLEVVAETDNGTDAAEMVRRFGVDVLVLDLSLSDGSGERVLDQLQAEGSPAAVVVFTAYASEPWRLLRKGVREVIEKPDFNALQEVLTRVSASLDEHAPAEDRRLASREVCDAPRMWRSPAGVSTAHDLVYSLQEVEPGDAVLAIALVGLESLEADVGPLLTADCRLAVAGALRNTLRVQDLLHEAPEVGGFVALLRGGDARAAGAVWSRLAAALRASGLPGEVKGVATPVDVVGGSDALARAVGALKGATVDSPPFVIL